MSAAAPWSVKGIDPKAREIAKDLARRSGMTLGEWLNSMIIEDGDADDGYTPLPRRAHASDTFERRGRSRRLDDAYASGGEAWQRLEASIDAIAARLEAAERRSTVAIQGVDQAVSGVVRRLENSDQEGRAYGRRIDDLSEELREGHRRLRKFEQETGPRTTETFGKVEAGLGALAGRLYDIEERQRSGVNELRQRMDAVEKAAGPGAGSDLLGQVGARLDQAQARTTEALRGLERSFAVLDQRMRAAETRIEPEGAREAARFEKLAETLARQVDANRAEMMRRLDTAESENRMERIERAVAALGDQLKASESRSAQAVEAMGREVLRIAENLNGRVARVEIDGEVRVERLGEALSRRIDGDMGRLAQGLDQRLTAADDRHALALEKLGGEITRISDRLSERIAQSERRSQQALEDIGRRLSDSSSRIEQRYDRASGELAERMRLSEERTAALIAEARENIDRRADSKPAPEPEPVPAPVVAASPIADIQPDWRAAAFPDAAFPDSPFAPTTFDDPDPVYTEQQAWSADLAPPEPEPAPEPRDEVLTADTVFDAVMRGPLASVEAAPTPAPTPAPAPFGSRAAIETPAEPEEAPHVPVFATAPQPAPEVSAPAGPFGSTGGFGGADVSDALAATAPGGFDGDDFAGETDFVDPRALRAAAAQGRASTTRNTIEAARAAMAAPEPEAPARSGFGLKKGGKSRLQERLDKQASRDGGTVRKALGASAVAVVLTASGALAFSELTDGGIVLQGLGGGGEAQPIAALAVVATPSEADLARGAELYEQAVAQLDADEATGADTLKQAATLGYAPAQLHLAGLYQEGLKGVQQNAPEARVWARRAADSGDPRGMHNYGMYLFDGVGGARNRAEALTWLTRAAERGMVDSQYNVAKLYETGDEGITADPVQAYAWYLIAGRAGDGDAQAAAERMQGTLSAADRTQGRADAERFTVEPLA
ncbi:SEL1-like repeat protein [Brevundimonas kwangchunensis]|uniref:SEL1-like repeat protein n=1 Tax=Brevundimonas kwangchunensis TaxID=322163 RepID=A0ABN1H5X2_9CAUL